jgi:hypothetical protein
VILLLWLT